MIRAYLDFFFFHSIFFLVQGLEAHDPKKVKHKHPYKPHCVWALVEGLSVFLNFLAALCAMSYWADCNWKLLFLSKKATLNLIFNLKVGSGYKEGRLRWDFLPLSSQEHGVFSAGKMER